MLTRKPVAVAVLMVLSQSAMASSFSFNWIPNYDGTATPAYPTGNKPIAGTTPPAGWTGANLGDGGGTFTDVAGDLKVSASGTNTIGNSRIIYKDSGAGDAQISGRVMNDYTGSADGSAGMGIGLREGATTAAWVFQIKSLQTSPLAQVQYGVAGGTVVNTNCPNVVSRPVQFDVTYDVSATTLKAFADGVECVSFVRNMSDVIGFYIAGSKSTTSTINGTIEDFAQTSTITVYTPDPPPPGAPSIVGTGIPDQTGTQGTAFSLDWKGYFSGGTSYSLGSSFPGALTESSDGVLSGTPNASDVSASPYSRDLCATNAVGTTCDSVTFQFAATPPGAIFTLATGTTSFDCVTSGVKPGDTIRAATGVHSPTLIKNCDGNANNYINFENNPAGAGRAIFRVPAAGNPGSDHTAGRPRYALKFDNSSYVKINGLVGWSGQPGRCGATASVFNGVQDGNETGVDVETDGCGIWLDGTTNNAAQDMLWLAGDRHHITVQGVETSGDWTCVDGDNDGDCDATDTNYFEGHGFFLNDGSFCSNDHPTAVLEGFTFRHNYNHNHHDTAWYLGANVKSTCNGQEDNEPEIRDMLAERNFVQYIGEGGAKFKANYGGDPTDAILRYNIFRDGGGSLDPTGTGHNSHMFSCFEASCWAYGNVFEKNVTDGKTGSGLTCNNNNINPSHPAQVCLFENNTFWNTSGPGINGSRKAGAGPSVLQARFNTLVNVSRDETGSTGACINAADSFSAAGGYIKNNICAGSTTASKRVDGLAIYDIVNNLQTAVGETGGATDAGFVNVSAKNFHIKPVSLGKDTATGTCPTVDRDGDARPQNVVCDRGSDEYTP